MAGHAGMIWSRDWPERVVKEEMALRVRMVELERQLADAGAENKTLRIAYGLALDLHGCGGTNCNETQYLWDAEALQDEVISLSSQLAEARERIRGLLESLANEGHVIYARVTVRCLPTLKPKEAQERE